MSSRLSTSRASRSRDSSAVASSSSRSSSVQCTSVRAQAGHRGLGRGQRGAQVVADRGEQRGAHPVGLGDRLGRLGLGRQPLLLQGRAPRRRRTPPAPAGRPRAAAGRAGPASACRSTGTSTSASSGEVTGSSPVLATTVQCRPAEDPAGLAGRAVPPGSPHRRPGTPAGSPSASRTSPAPAPAARAAPAGPRSTLPAVVTSSSDSAPARAACLVRRAAMSTTELTVTADDDEHADGARRCWRSAMVNWWMGGVK